MVTRNMTGMSVLEIHTIISYFKAWTLPQFLLISNVLSMKCALDNSYNKMPAGREWENKRHVVTKLLCHALRVAGEWYEWTYPSIRATCLTCGRWRLNREQETNMGKLYICHSNEKQKQTLARRQQDNDYTRPPPAPQPVASPLWMYWKLLHPASRPLCLCVFYRRKYEATWSCFPEGVLSNGLNCTRHLRKSCSDARALSWIFMRAWTSQRPKSPCDCH